MLPDCPVWEFDASGNTLSLHAEHHKVRAIGGEGGVKGAQTKVSRLNPLIITADLMLWCQI